MSKSYRELVKDTDKYFHKLMSIKWMDEWDEKDMEIIKKAIEDTAKENPELIVHCLADYSFDIEGITTAQDYHHLIKELFKAFDISIPFTSNQEGSFINITFTTPEADVSFKFNQEDDWMNEDILDFINDKVLLAYGEEKVFHPLPPISSSIGIVLQHPDIIDEAYDEGVIPDDDFFISED